MSNRNFKLYLLLNCEANSPFLVSKYEDWFEQILLNLMIWDLICG